MFRKLLLTSALLIATPCLSGCGTTIYAQTAAVETPEETIAVLQAENRALKAENARLKTMLRRALSSQSSAPQREVFATHEFAARGSLFVSDGTGSIYQEQFGNSLVQQSFEPKQVYPDGKTLEAGTRVRSLKVEKFIGENNSDWAHFVQVVDGPAEGTRGWVADSILVLATN